LAVELATRQREQWLAVHEPAMAAYNAAVDQHGVFSDGLRSF
jgi:antitoxin CcdA